MFDEGRELFQLYGLFNLFLSVVGAGLLIYLFIQFGKRKKQRRPQKPDPHQNETPEEKRKRNQKRN